MAIDPNTTLPVPENYATPEQLALRKDYIGNLYKGATRDQPITSPWQGVRMMADALAGNMGAKGMGQQEMFSRQHDNPGSLQGPWAQQQQQPQQNPPSMLNTPPPTTPAPQQPPPPQSGQPLQPIKPFPAPQPYPTGPTGNPIV